MKQRANGPHSRRTPWFLVCLVTIAVAVLAGLAVIGYRCSMPINLVECSATGWEAQNLDYFVEATANIGHITRYELDVNNDGVFDHQSDHNPKISGALEWNLPLLGLLGTPADNGKYPATVRIWNNFGMFADFPIEITIGNMPPEIVFGKNREGTPGQPFTLNVTALDPGPDIIQQFTIDWGDGITESAAPDARPFRHVYAKDGSYTIRVTVTDEDDSYWAEAIASIGNIDTPVVPSDEPQIVSANSEILASGNARLTLVAVDRDGSDELTYEWDRDGDGVFETKGGSTIEIAPGPYFHPYMVTVRVTDSKGRWTEGYYGFGKSPSQVRP